MIHKFQYIYCSNSSSVHVKVGGLYFTLNLTTPLLGLIILLALDLPQGNISESTVELLKSVTIVLGFSFILLLGLFLLLMDKKVRKWIQMI